MFGETEVAADIPAGSFIVVVVVDGSESLLTGGKGFRRGSVGERSIRLDLAWQLALCPNVKIKIWAVSAAQAHGILSTIDSETMLVRGWYFWGQRLGRHLESTGAIVNFPQSPQP